MFSAIANTQHHAGASTGESPRGTAVRTAVVEAEAPWRPLGDDPGSRWIVLITIEGRPCGYLAIPGDAGEGLLAATAGRQAARWAAERAATSRLRRRLGTPPASGRTPTVSVVVCTHRRHARLVRLLDSLRRLDPAPAEVIVVDNDPGSEACEGEAVDAGARYLREPRRGLNVARATGLRAATGDVVAFVDDDCIAPREWLRDLAGHFDDPTVGAVTGPLFADDLATEPKLMRERIASFNKGVQQRCFDWTQIWAVHSGTVGTGANMAFRREALLEIDEPFPPELDAGTPTRSGGDLYVLYKVIAAGHRIVYEPGAYLLHAHAASKEELLATVEGYGVGLSAFLARALVVDREPATFAVWRWLPRMWSYAALDLVAGTGDRRDVALRWRYLLGGFKGPSVWVRSRRAARDAAVAARQAGPRSPELAVPDHGGNPPSSPVEARTGVGVSIVVGFAGPRPALASLLARLAGAAGGDEVEVVVACPDAPAATAGPESPEGVRLVAARGAESELINAAVRTARGEVLLVLGADEDPDPGLADAHRRHHDEGGGERFVVGRSQAKPAANGSLATLAARLGDEDEQRLAREAAAPTFVDLPGGNVSLPRRAFERLGGLARGLDQHAALRDLALRGLRSGIGLVHAPEALTRRPLPAGAAALLSRAELAGIRDRRLLELHPEIAAALPVPEPADGRARQLAGAAAVAGLRRRRLGTVAVRILNALERLHMRRTWLSLARLAGHGAYERGLGRRARATRGRARGQGAVTVDVRGDDAITPPVAVAPPVELIAGRERAATTMPPGGHWHHDLFAPVLRAAPTARGRAFPRLSVAGRDDEASLRDRFVRREHPLDLDGVQVVCASERADERPALEAAGATVTSVESDRPEHRWQAAAAALASGGARYVAVALAWVAVRPQAIDALLPAFEAERTAVAVGAGIEAGEPPSPLLFTYPHPGRRATLPPRLPPQLIVMRASACDGLLDPSLGYLDAAAPLVDVVDRALAGGRLVAYAEVPGLDPPVTAPGHGAWARFERARARSVVATREAAALGGAQGAMHLARSELLPRARHLWRALLRRESRLAPLAGGTVAFAVGCARTAWRLRAARGPEPLRPAKPPSVRWDPSGGAAHATAAPTRRSLSAHRRARASSS